MTTAQRTESLMPNGEPRYVRCYDNGGRSFDRYTVIYSRISCRVPRLRGMTFYVGLSENPSEPQGFGQYGEAQGHLDSPNGFPPAIGRECHLGTRIAFTDLPPDCKRLILNKYRTIWKIQA